LARSAAPRRAANTHAPAAVPVGFRG